MNATSVVEISAAEQPRPTPIMLYVGNVLAGTKREEIAAALPAHVPFARFERNLANAVMRDPKLLRVDPRVVFREVCKIAALGLVLDPQLGEAYLIVDRHNDVQARVGYRGLMKLAHQSGKVSAIYAHDVCEFDRCKISLGTEKSITHEPDFTKPRGPAVAYYSVVRFKDGVTDFEPMSIAEIDAIRGRSDAYRAFKKGLIKSTPWETDYGEMAKKTTLRRLLKRVPMSPDLERALAMEDEADERDRVLEHEPAAPPPRTLSDKLDALAAPATDETTPTASADDADAATEETADAVDEDDRAAPHSEPAAVAGADNSPAAVTSPDKGEVEPATAEAYVDYAVRWILAETDPVASDARWKVERPMRNRLGVAMEDVEALSEKQAARVKALRGGGK